MPPATDTELAAALRVAVGRLARRLRRERASVDLSFSQLAALGTLDRHGPLTPGELATHEKVQPPSMTRTIARLEERGLVARTPHPTDRRQALVALTKQGAALLKEDRRRREEWLARRLRELPPDDLAVLRAAMRVLDTLGRL
jgi:DNA-binding MarR family transcriptional regulator